MSDMTVEISAKLREPFPAEMVGKLPRSTCRDCSQAPGKVCQRHEKKRCNDCGNYMTEQHIHLDYVGHAAVTDRLLRVDPSWSWEPMAYTEQGTPLVKDGLLWIKLTVAGVTRPGVGSADGKNGPDAVKEMIGDALRNAGMRFGIAIDLWSKEDLHATAPEAVADGTVIADLVARMNALTPDLRKQCKAMFFDAFGAPDQLRDASAAQAAELVASFETSASDAPGVADTSVPGADADPHAATGPGAVASSPGPDVVKPTQLQMRKLHACLRDVGIEGGDRHPFVSGHIGRDVTSLSDITRAEAAMVIDLLEQGTGGDAA